MWAVQLDLYSVLSSQDPEADEDVEKTGSLISLSRERPNPRPGFLTNPILKGNID